MHRSHLGARLRRSGRRPAWLLAVAAIGLLLAACGKTSASSSTSSSNSSGASSASSSGNSSSSAGTALNGCGTVPSLAIRDSSGVIAKLGSTYTAAYNGNLDPIFASAWAHSKPSRTSGLTVGMAFSEPANPYQVATISDVKKALLATTGVSNVTVLTSPIGGVTTQIQQVNQLIQQHVGAIVTEPLAPPAMAGLAAKAKAAGIPLIAVLNGIPSPDAVSVAVNSVADGLNMASGVGKLIGGKGNVIGVHGIPSTGNDQGAFVGFKAALAKCPNVKFSASIIGDFQVPVAKQATVTYLSSNPQPVAGALEAAVMGSGIIAAFDQTGRPQPALGNIQASAGDLAYWNAHKSTYKAVGTGVGPDDLARATAYTLSHILDGHGPKVSEIVSPGALITNANLSQWVVPGAGPTSQAVVSGPANSWLPDSYLTPLFNQ